MPIVRDNNACEVLSLEQRKLIPLLQEFSKTHILVGGTAISLQLQHRTSIDFDLFCFGAQGSGKSLAKRISDTGLQYDPEKSTLLRLSDEEQPEVTLFVEGVKVQLLDFSRNPFSIPVNIPSNKSLYNIPSLDLLYLGALKVYAMMYRAKRKDAVDLFFILHTGITLHDMIDLAQKIFTKLYKPEYTYETILDNKWDMTEQVEYLISFPPKDKIIQSYLTLEVKSLLEGKL